MLRGGARGDEVLPAPRCSAQGRAERPSRTASRGCRQVGRTHCLLSPRGRGPAGRVPKAQRGRVAAPGALVSEGSGLTRASFHAHKAPPRAADPELYRVPGPGKRRPAAPQRARRPGVAASRAGRAARSRTLPDPADAGVFAVTPRCARVAWRVTCSVRPGAFAWSGRGNNRPPQTTGQASLWRGQGVSRAVPSTHVCPVGTRLSPPATGVERGHQPFRRGLHTASPSAPQGILGPWPGRGAGQMPQGHVTTASRPGSRLLVPWGRPSPLSGLGALCSFRGAGGVTAPWIRTALVALGGRPGSQGQDAQTRRAGVASRIRQHRKGRASAVFQTQGRGLLGPPLTRQTG